MYQLICRVLYFAALGLVSQASHQHATKILPSRIFLMACVKGVMQPHHSVDSDRGHHSLSL